MDWKETGCALLQLPVSAPPSWTAAPSSGHWVGRGGAPPARKGGKDAVAGEQGNAANKGISNCTCNCS
jgi:hypothetical protein